MFAAVLVVLAGHRISAQENVTLRTDLTFYADNTEFFNPFREGETLLGTDGRIFLDVHLNDQVSVRTGLFVNHRNGSQELFEQWRPVLGLVVKTFHSEFLFGTIDSVERRAGPGPDRTAPHDLPSPLQRETLAFTRPYEAGLQWKLAIPQVEQDAWLNWQRLNTSEHRERFDVGFSGRTPLPVQLPTWLTWRFHLVHEGGQLYESGPVGDSFAGGPGFTIERPVWRLDKASAEVHLLWSRFVHDRNHLDEALTGLGWFLRLAGEQERWRGHIIVWNAHDFVKEEGDENYLARMEDGTLFPAGRRYGEIGLTRTFQPAEGLDVEGSARLHRVQGRFAYSYRILAIVGFEIPLRSQ